MILKETNPNIASTIPLDLTIGIIIALIVSIVIFGGLQRIADVASRIVPFMVIVYLSAGLFIVFSNTTSGSRRIDLKLTKHIIDLITNGKLDFSDSVKDKFFNLDIPLNLEGIDNNFLVPNQGWNNLDAYYETGNMLTELFDKNFKKFDISDPDILNAGPKIQSGGV